MACWFDADTIIRTGSNPTPSIEDEHEHEEDEDDHDENEYDPIKP